jgi:hypothetical protein
MRREANRPSPQVCYWMTQPVTGKLCVCSKIVSDVLEFDLVELASIVEVKKVKPYACRLDLRMYFLFDDIADAILATDASCVCSCIRMERQVGLFCEDLDG